MGDDISDIPSLQSLALGSEELELLRPVIRRMTRVASALFGAAHVDAFLFDGDGMLARQRLCRQPRPTPAAFRPTP